MAGGLVGLFDDVAAIARLAAASVDDVAAASGRATTKAAGVLIDDAAVTPQYVRGLAANRELPIIARITKGSLRNKFLFVLPVLLVLSEFLPWLLTPLLMLGGGYLCYEAVHKIWGALAGHGHAGDGHGHADVGLGDEGHADDGHGRDDHGAAGTEGSSEVATVDASGDGPKGEDAMVAGAIRTDLILSAEIMVIALNEVGTDEFGLVARAAILAVVAVLITVIVYGSVAVIVKMDDIGLRLAEGDGADAAFGRRLVAAMPRVLTVLGVVGTAAMLWVGGHIELVGLDEFGLSAPYDLLHDLEESIRSATGAVGGLLAWLVDTVLSAVFGLLVGIPIVAVQLVISRTSRPAQQTG